MLDVSTALHTFNCEEQLIMLNYTMFWKSRCGNECNCTIENDVANAFLKCQRLTSAVGCASPYKAGRLG